MTGKATRPGVQFYPYLKSDGTLNKTGMRNNSLEWAKQVCAPVQGIDRWINSLPYTSDNVAPCCWGCNRAKGNMDGPEFIEHIKKIANYLDSKQKD